MDKNSSDTRTTVDALVRAQREAVAAATTSREQLISLQKQVVTEILERLQTFKSTLPFTTDRKVSVNGDTVIFRPHTRISIRETKSWFSTKRTEVSGGDVSISICPSQTTPGTQFRLSVTWHSLGDLEWYEYEWANKKHNGLTFPPVPTSIDTLFDALTCFVAICKFQFDASVARERAS